MLIECSVEEHLDLIKDDPVRPNLFDADEARFHGPFRVFAEVDDASEEVQAVVCVVLSAFIVTEEDDLLMLANGEFSMETEDGVDVTHAEPTVACPYSIWSYKKGAGRQLISSLIEFVSVAYPTLDSVVTMSPKSDSALKFHTNNGAEMFSVNEDTINYLYEITEEVVLH
jgi:hypothetical protein